jgi:tetratricopeptide (TPR) repeat protein
MRQKVEMIPHKTPEAEPSAMGSHGNNLYKSLSIFLITALGAICYANSLYSPFHFDDRIYIEGNHAIRDLSNIHGIWSFNPQRFAAFLSFAANFKIHGLNVFGYHIVNLLVHILAAIGFFRLAYLIFDCGITEKPRREASARKDLCRFLALFATLLFVCHPIQTQAVTYIWQRSASLSAMFYIWSMAFYMEAAVYREKSKMKYRLSLALSFFSLLLASFCKQSAVTLPLAIAMLEIFFNKADSWKERAWRIFPFLISLAIIPILTFLVGDRQLYDLTNFAKQVHTPARYFLTQLSVVAKYLSLLILPLGQNLDYDYPVSKSFFEQKTFLSFLLLSFIAGAGFFFMKKDRVASFGIFFFFLALSVESSFIPLEDFIFEHRLYLPSAGFFLFMASLLASLMVRVKKRLKKPIAFCLALNAFLLIVFLPLTCATIRRNEIWKSEESLWLDVYAKSPNKPRVIRTLAEAKAKAGKFEEAVGLYERALSVDSEFWECYNDLGVLLGNHGEMERAKVLFEKAAVLASRSSEPLVNLGAYFKKKGNIEEAENYFKKSISVQPENPGPYLQLSGLFADLGRYEQAIECMESFIRADNSNHEIFFSLGKIQLRNGNLKGARTALERSVSLNPIYAPSHDLLGIVLEQEGEILQARASFERAISIDKSLVNAYLNLGYWLETRQDKEDAYTFYLTAEKMCPDSYEISLRLGQFSLSHGDKKGASSHLVKALKKCHASGAQCPQSEEIRHLIHETRRGSNQKY